MKIIKANPDAKPMKIVLYPDPFLYQVAREVTPAEIKAGKADDYDLKELVARMLATMYDAQGIGLAGPQVRVGLRLFVADISDDRDEPFVLFNPVFSNEDGAADEEEGCLSIPEVRAKVRRPYALHVSGLDLDGEPVEFDADDLLARVCQHETDHLDGILFLQYIGTAARFMNRRKLKMLEEDYEFIQRRKG